ncbi:hypothetical protein EDD11_008185, partial [Mortierella claussenii]
VQGHIACDCIYTMRLPPARAQVPTVTVSTVSISTSVSVIDRALGYPTPDNASKVDHPSIDGFTRGISPEFPHLEMPSSTPSFRVSQQEARADISSMLPSVEGTPEPSVQPPTQNTSFSLTTLQEATLVAD